MADQSLLNSASELSNHLSSYVASGDVAIVAQRGVHKVMQVRGFGVNLTSKISVASNLYPLKIAMSRK